jgi:hypothetical protein
VTTPADVYISPPVAAVRALYGKLVGESSWTRSPAGQLRLQADRLAEGHRRQLPGAAVELSNWHPHLVGHSPAAIWAADLRAEDFLLTLARQHGYDRTEDIPDTAGPVRDFESAVEAVLDGDVDTLTGLLDAEPDLVVRRSRWGHGATLLHYVAANGVETYRQRVPVRAAEVASLLLSRGADAHATAHVYGGRQTTLGLLLTSSHPRDAGVTSDIARILTHW